MKVIGNNRWIMLLLLTSVFLFLEQRLYTQQQVRVVELRASSTFMDEENKYSVEKVFDDDPSTAWVEGTGHGGIGESITISLDREITVDGIKVMPGYFTFREFREYSRVAHLIATGGGQQIPLRLKDKMVSQLISIDPVTFREMELKIRRTYKGERTNAAAIAEIAFYRDGKKINLIFDLTSSLMYFVDHFESNLLDPAWTWSRAGSAYSLTASPGYFSLIVSSGEDTWLRSSSFFSPRLYQPVPIGSWIMTTYMKGYPGASAQCGLLFFQNINNWLGWGYVFDELEADSHLKPGVGLEGLIRDTEIEELHFAPINKRQWKEGVYLQVRFDDNTKKYHFYYSLTSTDPWIYQGAMTLVWNDVRVGVWGKSWHHNSGYRAWFDYFQIRYSDLAYDTPAQEVGIF